MRKRSWIGLYMLSALAVCLGVTLGGPACAWEMLDEVEGPFAVGGLMTVTDPAALSLKLMFGGPKGDEAGGHYVLEVSGRKASLTRHDGEQVVALGVPGELPEIAEGQEIGFALHRDEWRIAFIWDGRVVITAYDGSFHGPAAGYEAAGVDLDDVWLQLLGEIDAGDSFERTEKEDEEDRKWEHVAGKWRLISLREDRQAGQMQADKSANAFSYYGTAEETGLASMGSWFWRNCQYSLAVRARGNDGAVGLAFYLQDESNYLLARWDCRFTSAEGGPHLRLMSVVDGKIETLAERPGGYFPDQWCLLQVNVCDERVYVVVDGVTMLTAQTDLFGQGGMGLYVEGKGGAWFDDARVVNWGNMVDPFERENPGKWVAASGEWAIGDGVARPTGAAPGMLVTGSPQWQSYSLSAEVSGQGGGAGLAVCTEGPADGYLFRWARADSGVAYAGKAQLVRLGPDGEKVLVENETPAGLPTTVRATVIAEEDYIAGMLGNRRLVEVMVPPSASGGVGLFAEGAEGVTYDDLRMMPLAPRRVARVAKEFTDTKTHHEMAAWSSPRHAWVEPEEGDEGKGVWWTKGDFYGPLQIQLALKGIGEIEGTMRVMIADDRGEEARGAQLALTATKGSKKLGLKLVANGEELGACEVEAESDPCPISVERRGRYLVVNVDGKLALQAEWDGGGAAQ